MKTIDSEIRNTTELAYEKNIADERISANM